MPYELLAFRVPAFDGEIEFREHSQIKWVTKAELSLYDFPEPDLPIIAQLIGCPDFL